MWRDGKPWVVWELISGIDTKRSRSYWLIIAFTYYTKLIQLKKSCSQTNRFPTDDSQIKLPQLRGRAERLETKPSTLQDNGRTGHPRPVSWFAEVQWPTQTFQITQHNTTQHKIKSKERTIWRGDGGTLWTPNQMKYIRWLSLFVNLYDV